LTVSIRPIVFTSSIENFVDLQEQQNTSKKSTMLVGFIMGHAKKKQTIKQRLIWTSFKDTKDTSGRIGRDGRI